MRGLSLRVRLIVILTLAVTLPILGSGYVLIQRAEHTLIAEKESKLFGIARSLDINLIGDYDSLLSNEEKALPTQKKILVLNSKLKAITDKIVAANPGVGAGYYSKDLDAIITYGPSSEFSNTIGNSIALDHKGREVMAEGVPKAVRGQMVRGSILNAMVPLERNGQIIGYAWANELTENVDHQIRTMEIVMYLTLGTALFVGLITVLLLATSVSSSVQKIIAGLRRLRSDFEYRMPMAEGEFGEITEAINKMAISLEKSRSHTEVIMESMVDGVITIDNEGKLTEINGAAERICGLKKDAIGKQWSELLAEQVSFQELILETLETGKAFIGYEVILNRNDGSTVPLSVSTSTLRNKESILGTVIVFKDLSERKVFEDWVRRIDRLAAVGELAAGVAHEIRNPLTAISGSAEILIDEIPEDSPSRMFGDIIIKEIVRLDRIVEDLLYFAKPSKNYLSQTDPNKLVSETLDLLTPSLKKECVVLNKELDSNIGMITVDSGLIKQVLVNLLLNAAQAMTPKGGEVKVRTRGLENGIEIEVMDTGCGIDPENLERIFDPFYTTKDRGTGLGLAVSNKIVEIHHGQLTVESIKEAGSTFTLFLPYITEA